MTPPKPRLPALLCLLLLGGLVAGCAGGSSSDAAGGDGAVADRAGLAAPEVQDAGESEPQDAAKRQDVSRQAVIRTASVELESDDVAAARLDVLAVSDRHRGEVAEEETASGDEGELSHARLVLRVPSEEYAEARDEIEEVADFESSSSGAEDVTTQVIDNEARIRAQSRGVRRLEALIDRAADLSEIVDLEEQLTRRQADLDSLRSQQAYLTDQTSLSTITVNIRAEEEGAGDGDDAGGFLAGLEDGWHGLGTLVTGTLTVVGVLLPFAVLAALLGAPGWAAYRSLRRRRGDGPIDPQAT